jgi:hypothetical protein
MALYLLYALLCFFAFLVMLNGFLIGAKKAKIDAVLSIILIGLIIVIFAIYGWKAGLIALVITFISAIISRPFAAKAANKLLWK